MNCPTCGAENSEDAQFCRECGSQLEEQELPPAVAVASEFDGDATLISTSLSAFIPDEPDPTTETVPPPAPFNEEHTPPASRPVSPVVDTTPEPTATDIQDDSVAANASQRTPPADTAPVLDANKRGSSRQLIVLVGSLVGVLLLCCCCSLLVGALLGSDPEVIEDIIDELSTLPAYLPLIWVLLTV